MEYTGADPGYQTWAVASLAQIWVEAPEIVDIGLLRSSLKFLAAFALPNGSFAEGVGARLTSFLMSAGPELMAGVLPEASFLAHFARSHIVHRRFVSLDSIDEPNLAPFFNDVLRAAEAFDAAPSLRPEFRQSAEINFPKAGLFVRHHQDRSLIVSSVRGGYVCVAKKGRSTQISAEPVFRDFRSQLFMARAASKVEIGVNSIVVSSEIRLVKSRSQSPMKLVLLRLFFLSIGRWQAPKEYVKSLLVRYPLNGRHKSVGHFQRVVDLQNGETLDRFFSSRKLLETGLFGAPNHMASYGYWRY